MTALRAVRPGAYSDVMAPWAYPVLHFFASFAVMPCAASMVCTWPKMNPEGIEWFLGLLDGEMSHLPADVKAKHKK